ncbi:MAG: glycine betaine ABC transporter substrate-binding protein [Actinomycetota bacterium]
MDVRSPIEPPAPSVGPPPARGRRRRRLATLLGAALVLAACSSTPSAEEVETSVEPTAPLIRPTLQFVVNDWTASALNVAVAEQLIEANLGYPVVPVRMDDTREIYEELADGEVDAVLEIWPSSMSDQDRLYFDRDQVVDIGPLGATGKVGWFVPQYMIDADPALAGWEGYTESATAARFATATSGGRGRFLGTNPDYAQYDEQLIDNLGLPFTVQYSGSEAATLAEVEARVEAREPVLLYWWTPTSAVARFDLVNVALPAHGPDCTGPSAAAEGRVDCDYPTDELFKAVSVELPARAPEVLAFLQQFTLTTDDQLSMLTAVEMDGLTIDAAASAWIAANPDRWQPWLGG